MARGVKLGVVVYSAGVGGVGVSGGLAGPGLELMLVLMLRPRSRPRLRGRGCGHLIVQATPLASSII